RPSAASAAATASQRQNGRAVPRSQNPPLHHWHWHDAHRLRPGAGRDAHQGDGSDPERRANPSTGRSLILLLPLSWNFAAFDPPAPHTLRSAISDVAGFLRPTVHPTSPV